MKEVAVKVVRTLLIGFALLVMGSATAWAQDVVYQKHTVVDFGDDTIDGNLTKPDGQYLESQKRLRHQRLIKVRENFRTEILQSIHGL